MKNPHSSNWKTKRKKLYKKAVNKKSVSPQKKEAHVGKIVEKKDIKEESKRKKLPEVHQWVRRHDSDIQLILFPLILFVLVIILFIINNQIASTLVQGEPIADNFLGSMHPYPYVQAVTQPTITAEAALILDRDSQVILYSKNPQLRFSLASTTKIMTATIALSHYKPDDILTVKKSYVPGSGMSFFSGEQFHFMDLMYAMLLPSANDAAQAIADNYPGGESAFVYQMNQKAQSLHLNNTHYSDPIGLDDDGDYSTVIDLARLASYAITNPTFAEITATKYKTIYPINSTHAYQLITSNDLLGIDGVTGIKTGTTEGAGEVLVTSVVKNGHTYIIIVMDSTDRFGDTSRLINYITDNVKYVMPQQPQ